MEQEIILQVEKDHLESLTRASGITAVSELIWNALDSDASYIDITSKDNPLGIQSLTIEDDGHGLTYSSALEVFGKIGGSEKKEKSYSPNGRVYHGKEGKGRYKALALGDLVVFQSTYKDGASSKAFSITLDRNSLKKPRISEPILPINGKDQGFMITVKNLNQKNCKAILGESGRRELEEKFALYSMTYPTFKINIDGTNLEFSSLIENVFSETKTITDEDKAYDFTVKIVEWRMDCQKKIYLCNSSGISYAERNLGIRSTIPVSISIQSDYIEYLHREALLDVAEMNPLIVQIITDAKAIGREYLRNRIHRKATDFIQGLKKEHLYPYKQEASTPVEEAERQVFDILALHVNEYMPSFNDQDLKGKKLTLSLIKEALSHDTSGLQKILTDIIELPTEKREELSEILNNTTLDSIIDTMNEISNRLTFLHALEQIVYNTEVGKNVKERKHLHKLIVNETWMFGDDYTYGADDVSLANVLKAHLEFLGREDYEGVVDEGDNTELGKIPDVCLWRQFNRGRNGKFENLIIELKKPILDAGMKEYNQISMYASRVQSDPRFVKENHQWTFILLVRDIKEELHNICNQNNRRYGHAIQAPGLDVFILRWSDVIAEARARHQYIKEKLNLNLIGDEKALNFLRDKYKQYLPDEF